MLQNKRTPTFGLQVLEDLNKKNHHNQRIRNSLINAYICLGFHDNAIELIKKYYGSRQDIQSLKFQAWVEHKRGNIEKERTIWNTILDRTYLAEVHNPIDTLILRSEHSISLKPSDIPLFGLVRNEMLRLPFFLRHYRKLGVTQFIFVDNNSDDGSFEYLLAQPDCHVFWTNDSFAEAGCGVAWVNQIMYEYALENQWCLFVDADEFLIYPQCEFKSLRTLAMYLENNNEEVCPSYMLDIYPQNLRIQLDITSSSNIIKCSPFFYNNYKFYSKIDCSYQNPRGGLYSLYNYIIPLVKTGLFKYNKNTYFMSASHSVTPLIASKVTSTYLHCKFIGDVSERTINEIRRKAHFDGAKAYQRYKDIFEALYLEKDFDFSKLRKAVEFESSQQLVDLGLIKTTDSWDNYASK